TADPFDLTLIPAHAGRTSLSRFADSLARFTTPALDGLPPFQGGVAGILGYELGASFEQLPVVRHDEFEFPAIALGWFDVVVAFDHVTNRAFLISQGLPETSNTARHRRATDRLRQFQCWLDESPRPLPHRVAGEPLAIAADHHEVPNPLYGAARNPSVPSLFSNFTAPLYLDAVQSVVDYIHAGDVFQANLSQRLLYPARDHAVELYLRLRSRSPAPFACYFDLGDFQIASASPERFVSVRDRQVEARPIKGTRQRTDQPEADLFAADDLMASAKDRAENIMIVDLFRNDLSRVCAPESLFVPQLCGLEDYGYIQHLVSVVRGQLADGCTPWDLVAAGFPGGSITGAPKVRAMEIITELEQVARGAYCGSAGYFGLDGSADLSILIRTITCGRGWWQLPVGGGIVADSVPAAEHLETWHKAAGMLAAISP
ncbi:MAG: anthranilate synthase component I family protein, partial [Planctomycetales bacterium]|nr:anthranilate synthase component I family protein [Planctomycetales bacterium]